MGIRLSRLSVDPWNEATWLTLRLLLHMGVPIQQLRTVRKYLQQKGRLRKKYKLASRIGEIR